LQKSILLFAAQIKYAEKNQDLGTPDNGFNSVQGATKYFRISNPVDVSGTVFSLTFKLKSLEDRASFLYSACLASKVFF